MMLFTLDFNMSTSKNVRVSCGGDHVTIDMVTPDYYSFIRV